MKNLLLISLMFFLINSSRAQDTTFKLSDYKNPDYLYQMLDLTFNLSNALTTNNLKSKEMDNSRSSHDFSFATGAGAIYSLYANSPNKQSEIQAAFAAGIGTTNYNSRSDSYKNNNSSFNNIERLDIFALRRFYNPKQSYIEIDGFLNGSNQGDSEETTSNISGSTLTQKNTIKDSKFNISGSFLFGKGRIEQVQDARLAMYLIDDLKKLNRLQGIVSNEKVFELAKVITKLKYKRFFDDRLRKIAEITTIDSFMQGRKITSIPDAMYFTSLNDNWNYANNPIRYSGKRMYTGIEAGFGFGYNEHSEQSSDPDANSFEKSMKIESSNLYMVAGVTYEKPVSLRWQNSANAKIGIGVHTRLDNFKNSGDIVGANEFQVYTQALPALTLSGDYGLGFYPNSRTWLTAKWWLHSGWDKQMRGTNKDDKTDDLNSFYTYTGPKLQAYFFISEKLRLSLTFSGELHFDTYKYTYEVEEGMPEKFHTTFWNHQLYAAFTYSLF